MNIKLIATDSKGVEKLLQSDLDNDLIKNLYELNGVNATIEILDALVYEFKSLIKNEHDITTDTWKTS